MTCSNVKVARQVSNNIFHDLNETSVENRVEITEIRGSISLFLKRSGSTCVLLFQFTMSVSFVYLYIGSRSLYDLP